MSQAKLQAAKELIQEKRFHEARILLEATDHPTAKAWLAKLPKSTNRNKQPKTNLLLRIVFTLILCITAFGAGMYFGRTTSAPVTTRDVSTSVGTAATVYEPTAIATSLPTDPVALTPSPIPTETVTPSPIPTDTATLTASPTQNSQIPVIRQNLEDFCVPLVRMVAIMNAIDQVPEGIFGEHGLDRIQNASDIESACTAWTDTIINSSLLDTAVYCREKADADFREKTMFDCLLERDFLQSFFPDSSFGITDNFNNYYSQMFNSAMMAGRYDNTLLDRYGYR